MPGYLGTATRKHELEQLGGVAEAERRDLVTSVKGTIVAYDAASQTATVQPAYSQKIGDAVLKAPELLKVPVQHPRGGGYVTHFPLKPGSAITLTAMMRPLDAWQENGGAHDGAPGRMHDWSNMIAMPGGEPDTKALPAAATNGFWQGSDDGKRGLSASDNGNVSLRGGPTGTDKLKITSDGKVDLIGENGTSALQLVRNLAVIVRDHLNASAAMDPASITAVNNLITQLDGMKA